MSGLRFLKGMFVLYSSKGLKKRPDKDFS
jgi:hypothetical protein